MHLGSLHCRGTMAD